MRYIIENECLPEPCVRDLLLAVHVYILQDCMWCENPARIRCIQCSQTIFMCTDCDNRVHMQMPFHNREAWVSTHFTLILPTCTMNDSEDSTFKTTHMYIQFYDISITYVLVHKTSMAFMDTSKMSKMSRSWKFKKIIVSV